MVASHSFVLRFALPRFLPADFVIRRLQEYEPLITPHPYLVRFARRPLRVEEVQDDSFFREDGHKLQAFVITEKIKFVPGLSKDITIPAVFQSFDTGARVRADAQGGVRVWSSYGVEPGEGDAEWDLVERVELTCGSFVKPFVVGSIVPAHQTICERLLGELASAYAENGKTRGLEFRSGEGMVAGVGVS